MSRVLLAHHLLQVRDERVDVRLVDHLARHDDDAVLRHARLVAFEVAGHQLHAAVAPFERLLHNRADDRTFLDAAQRDRVLVEADDPITLGGVKEGTIVGTVVQQPYEWGYQGMKDMAKFLEGDKSFVPANKLIIVPTKIIEKGNVDAFWAELKERQGKK